MAGEAYKEVNIGKEMCDALEQQYRGNIASAKANVRVYLENPAGIGEHPAVVQALDTQIAIIAENQEKLDILNSRAFNFPGDRYPVE